MNLPPPAILYSEDEELVRRIKAFLRMMAAVRYVAEPDRLDAVLQQTGPSVFLVDLRARESRELIDQVQKDWPDVLTVALGVPHSDPLREAEECGIYAAEDLELDRNHFQALIGRAFDLLRVMQENRELREQQQREPAAPPPPPPRIDMTPENHQNPALQMMRLGRAFRRMDNVDTLLESLVESVADVAKVSRVGIFSRIRQGDRYRLRAGLRCLPETRELEFSERDPLVRWFEQHAHLISRMNLAQTDDLTQRAVIRRALDTFGAEVIVPVYARGRIIGWIFFGHRITGQPFTYADLESLMMLGEQISTVLENTLLYEEVTVQKTLAETLLKAIPIGIVATDEEGVVRWFSPAAEQILGVSASDVLNRQVEGIGSNLASIIRETLDAKANISAQQWVDPITRRSLLVTTRRLADHRVSLGVVAVVQDMTVEENLRQKQELLERSAFWTDLAASMSHEIRNPLVAIKTFAQLLPERFDDADFRKDFNEIVVQEIDRLDKIITQINDFAHPAELVMKAVDLHGPVQKAVEMARRSLTNGTSIETELPNDLPRVWGDESALTEAFAHLVANAAEATSGLHQGRITLAVKPLRNGDAAKSVMVIVKDNGSGIAPDLRDKIFSPFCTTKARGIGLGLPIVKRTIFDHNGRVDIDSNPQGTRVSVILPIASEN